MLFPRFPSSSSHHKISNDCFLAQIRALDCRLWHFKVLPMLLVKVHMAPTWVHLIRTIPRSSEVPNLPSALTYMVENHPPLNPPMRLRPHFMYRVTGIQHLTLNAPFFFLRTYPLESRDLELPKDQKIFPRGSGLWPFHIF
jgi:hypothetical protein